MTDSDWTKALDAMGLDLETLRLILRLAYDFQMQTGREMKAIELRAALRQPGA